jgi:hypothetical protein
VGLEQVPLSKGEFLMSDLSELLHKIRQKPAVYLGVPSLSNLYMFLCGYGFSRQELGLPLTVEEALLEGFQPWLQQRFRIDVSASWAKIILLYSVDERAGFELFFNLWDEFIAQQQQAAEGCEKILA